MRSSSIRRALAAASAVSVLALSVSACAEDTANDSTVDFGYIGDYNGVSLLAIAKKQGLWKKAGLTAKVKAFNDGPVQVQALGAGDLDFGYIGPGAMWLPASGKAKVVSVNTLAYADRVMAQGTGDFAKMFKEKENEILLQVARAEPTTGSVLEAGLQQWRDDGSADVLVATKITTKSPDGKQTIESGSRWVATAVKEGQQWKISNLIQVI